MSQLPETVVDTYANDDQMAPEIIASIPPDDNDYFHQIIRLKLAMAQAAFTEGRVLDIGCANGVHLDYIVGGSDRGAGVDITSRYLEYAGRKFENLSFVRGDVCALPFADNSFDGVYSFGSLYYVADYKQTSKELFRVVKNGGEAVLDIGNRRSINYRLSVEVGGAGFIHCDTHSAQLRALQAAGFTLTRKRYFQVLPYWGSSSGIRRLLINSRWKKLMQRKLGSRMLDEIISSLPLFRRYAFRCLVTCRKDTK